MARVKPINVATPGSTQVPKKKKRGRPKSQTKVPRAIGKYKANFNERDIDEAVSAVKERVMSVREAASNYVVPKSTLADKVKVSLLRLTHFWS